MERGLDIVIRILGAVAAVSILVLSGGCDGNTSKVTGPAQVVTVCLETDKKTGDKSQVIDNSTNVSCDKTHPPTIVEVGAEEE